MTDSVVGYALAYSDEFYEGPSIIPSTDVMPRRLYRTVEAAEEALGMWKNNLPTFQPIMYGEVFPYDKTTAREQIAKKGYALYGWTVDEVDGEPVRYGIFICAFYG